jgi:protein TonB
MRTQIPATVKLNSLQIGFGVSIFFHLALASAVVALGGFGSQPPVLTSPERAITIVLLAAPEKIVTPPQPIIAPPKVEPVKSIATVEKIVERAVTEITQSIPAAPVVTPVAKPLPPEKISGDGSSPKPGLDLTTKPAPLVAAQPDYLKNPEPPYPPTARRRHQEGLVLLRVKVNPHGRALSVEIKNSSGFPLLDEAAQTAVRDWEFQPARLGLLAVESEIEVPVRFKLMP